MDIGATVALSDGLPDAHSAAWFMGAEKLRRRSDKCWMAPPPIIIIIIAARSLVLSCQRYCAEGGMLDGATPLVNASLAVWGNIAKLLSMETQYI